MSEIKKALNVINAAQDALWMMHFMVKNHDEKLGMAIWDCTLQIESALRALNRELFNTDEYWENEES